MLDIYDVNSEIRWIFQIAIWKYFSPEWADFKSENWIN